MSTNNSLDHVCAVCQKEAQKRCGRCKLVWYCDAEHQRAHWKQHKVACNDAYQADQYTLHKQEFDRIIKTYGLDREEKAEAMATFLTQGTDGNSQVSAPEFAQKFGVKLEEAVVILEWIKLGVNFKQKSIDTAKKAGFANSS